MLNNIARKLIVLPAVALVSLSAVGPVAAQGWYDGYYVNPGYTSYPSYTYFNPGYYDYDDYSDYRYRRPMSSVVKGAAIGGAAGFGLSFLGRRHNRHIVRNTAIGAGIGAGIGLLDCWF